MSDIESIKAYTKVSFNGFFLDETQTGTTQVSRGLSRSGLFVFAVIDEFSHSVLLDLAGDVTMGVGCC